MRQCGCGCRASLAGKHVSARYASDACRARAWKARTGYRRETAGNGTRNGRPVAQATPVRRRGGVLVYLESPEIAVAVLAALDGRPDLELAAAAIGRALERRARRADR